MKIGWCCTYVPLEILEAAGLEPRRLLPPPHDKEDALLDPNLCPYIRAVMSHLERGASIDGLVLVNSCDGMRRLYDVVRHHLPSLPVFLLDVPRRTDGKAVEYFTGVLEALSHWVEEMGGGELKEDDLKRAILRANETRGLLQRLAERAGGGVLLRVIYEGFQLCRDAFNGLLRKEVARAKRPQGVKVLLTGALLDVPQLGSLVEELGGEVVKLDLCTGLRTVDRVKIEEAPLYALAEAYLTKPPCARMEGAARKKRLKEMVRGVKGAICYIPKFCDTYHYELPTLKGICERKGVPLLVIEGEYTGRISGWIRTRVQAFLERWR